MFEYTLPVTNQVAKFRAPTYLDKKDVYNQYIDKRPNLANPRILEIELLAARCLLSLNNQPFDDPHEEHRFDFWQVRDVTDYRGLFAEMFLFTRDDQEKVKAVTDAAQEYLEKKVPVILPASGNSVQFKAPIFSDIKVVRSQTEQKQTYNNFFEAEAIAGLCLTGINGERLPVDAKRIFDRWDLRDVDFYVEVFNELYTKPTKERIDNIQNTAKKLLSGSNAIENSEQMSIGIETL